MDYEAENYSYFNNSFYERDFYYTNFESLAGITTLLRNIFIPCIIIFGLIGNTLSVVVFASPAMKKSSSALYLLALACVDNLFLVHLLLTWIDGQFWNIHQLKFTCEIITFVTYVTSFLSVWFVVGFTTDRFIAICFPLKSLLLISVTRTKVYIAVLVVTACLLYSFSFWVTDTVIYGGLYKCVHKVEAVPLLQVITWIDSAITVVVPFFLISFMNIKVLVAALRCHKKNQRKETKTRESVSKSTDDLLEPAAQSSMERSKLTTPVKMNVAKYSYTRYKVQLRITRLLVLVSATFLVLNLPSHTMRLYNLIVVTAQKVEYLEVSVVQYFLHELSLLLYYCTFSCNFILYAMAGHNFKRTLKGILKCSSPNKDKKDLHLIRSNTRRRSCLTVESTL